MVSLLDNVPNYPVGCVIQKIYLSEKRAKQWEDSAIINVMVQHEYTTDLN